MYLTRRSTNLAKKIRLQKSALSTINNPKQEIAANTDWNSTIGEAEKIVGYPTSFLNLRWLLNDEVANVALHLRKLIGTNHPLLKTAKKLLLQNDTPSWGLIVLLASKAAGQNAEFSVADRDLTAGVLHSQRVLSEVTEMIRSSHVLHQSLMNVDLSDENLTDLNFGNKIALLSGDYLLSTSFRELAHLKNHELNELMSSALRDLAEGEFIGPRDKQNRPFPARPRPGAKKFEIIDDLSSEPLRAANVLGNAEAEWTLRNVLGGARLLGKSCQGSFKLAGHSEELQKYGYLFGKHFALTMQACKDLESVRTAEGAFSLVSAPVLFHLKHEPDLYVEIEEMIEDDRVNWTRLRELVKAGPGMEDTKKLQEENCGRALEALNELPQCDSRASLERILNGTRLNQL